MAANIFCTQETSAVTRAYTPGVEVEQVLLPQDTMPTRVQAPSFWQTRGPPESPMQEETPLAPAQIILLVILLPQ